MKKIVILLFAIVVLSSCGNKQKDNTTQITESRDIVEVLYFHGKQRCVTCNAIEQLTREVINESFSEKVKEGKLSFKIIDISKAENEKLAEKYEVSWSSLILCKRKNGEETINNMTKIGFSYAKNAPERFKISVRNKIEELLK